MSATMLATYPEIFAGGAIIAGLPHGIATSIPEAFDCMRGHGSPNRMELHAILRRASAHNGAWPRISIWHGAADHTVVPSNAEAVAGQWSDVHEVSGSPTHVHRDGAHTRLTWTNTSGDPVIEINSIAGMGHGIAIDGNDLGAPGPFMLDFGVSSTREIAQFWRIAPATKDGVPPLNAFPEELASNKVAARQSNAQATNDAKSPTANARPTTPPSSPGVKKIIEDALRKAGLMK